jgi:transposase
MRERLQYVGLHPCQHLVSRLVGLVPAEYVSGDKCITLGLTNRRNRYLREMLIEAAWVAKRRDPALTMAYNKLVQRMDPNEAIIRIAKKLLRRIRGVWKNRRPYVLGVVA